MDAATDPNIGAVIVDKDLAVSSQLAALAGGVAGGNQPARAHELRGPAVERAGDGILEFCGKRAHFIGSGARVCGAITHSHHAHLGTSGSGLNRAHGRGIAQLYKLPAGPIIHPGGIKDVCFRDIQSRAGLCKLSTAQWPTSAQGRGGKRINTLVLAHGDQPHPAFLHYGAFLLRFIAERPPDGGATQGGVAGEIKLLVRGKNAHAIVRRGIGGLEQERGFRKIGPVRDGLHLLRREPIGMGHDGERVTGKRRGGKDIDFKELELHARQCSQPWE